MFVDGADDSHPGYLRVREGDGRPGAVILAVRDGQIAMVEVYRRPLGRSLLELPRGYRDDGETVEQAACRELAEETGLSVSAERLIALGAVAPNGGVLESVVELFMVVVPDGAGPLSPADREVGSARWMPVAEVLRMASEGVIIDSFTLATLLRALTRGLLPGESIDA